VGAWLSAVFIIPIIKKVDAHHGMMTYPDFLRVRYDDRVALAAAIIADSDEVSHPVRAK